MARQPERYFQARWTIHHVHQEQITRFAPAVGMLKEHWGRFKRILGIQTTINIPEIFRRKEILISE